MTFGLRTPNVTPLSTSSVNTSEPAAWTSTSSGIGPSAPSPPGTGETWTDCSPIYRQSGRPHCSVCVDIHTRVLAQTGESSERIHTAAAWRETP